MPKQISSFPAVANAVAHRSGAEAENDSGVQAVLGHWRRWLGDSRSLAAAALLAAVVAGGIVIILWTSGGQMVPLFGNQEQYDTSAIVEVLDAEREERKATSLGAHAVRNDRVRLILDGAPVDVERSSELMNYELTRYHTGLVMWHEGPTAQQGVFEDLVLAAGRSVGDRNPIIMPAGAYAVWAWIGTRDEVVIDRLKNALQGVTQGRIVVGPTRYGIQGFRTTHTACLEMQRVFSGRSMGPGIAWYRDFAVSTLVGQDSQRAKDFVHDTLGTLAQTSKRAARLRQTLRIYLAEGSNAPRTAELLHMHRNTVRQRIDSAAELLGYDPEQHRLAVELALELHHKLGL